ncbi:retrotransposon protein, putative, ty1-copia subclass [Tanacetum coccineum]
MKDNQVWVLVDLPPNGLTVGSKSLFKKKTNMDSNVYTFKARLVAKGYTQTYGVDYGETFSPVADIRAIKILLAIVAFFNYEIWQMDVKTAFLNGHLSEDNKRFDVKIKKIGFTQNPDEPCVYLKASGSNVAFLVLYVDDILLGEQERWRAEIEAFEASLTTSTRQRAELHFKVSIYGSKQASRSWNKRFDKEIKNIGFTQNPDEPCVYLKASGSNVAFLVLYVKDILIMGNDVTMLQDVKSWLCKCFSMKDLGEAAYILGIKIIRDRFKRLIALSQSAYFDKILKKFKMENSKRGSVPMQEKHVYRKSQGAQTPGELKRMQRVPYASAIGSIMYATDKDDTKSHSGYVFVLNDGALDWKSAKQSTIAMSFTKAKYIVAVEASMKVVWMRKLINRLGHVIPTNKRPMEILCDNPPAIAIVNDPRIIKGAKDYQRKYHYIREVIQDGEIVLKKVHTYDNLAGPFTKPMPYNKHFKHVMSIGVCLVSSHVLICDVLVSIWIKGC